MKAPVLFLCLFMGATAMAAEPAKLPPDQLAARAAKVLERNCLQCHRGAGSASKLQFDVRKPESMIDAGLIATDEDPKESKSKGERSTLWQRAHRGTMPPPTQPQLSHPTGEDLDALKAWIDAGTPAFPRIAARPPISLQQSLELIRDDLRKLGENKARGRQRYFSLIEMYNNPNVSLETINLARAALAKTINSLSWERELVIPRAIDPDKTIFAVDIEALGWTRDHWRAIRAKYPYGIGFNNLQDETLQGLDEEIQMLARNSETLYRIRADWFIVTALKPALYHALLYDLTLPELKRRLPDGTQPANPQQMTALDLERELGIDVIANILRGEDRAALWIYSQRSLRPEPSDRAS